MNPYGIAQPAPVDLAAIAAWTAANRRAADAYAADLLAAAGYCSSGCGRRVGAARTCRTCYRKKDTR